MELKVLLEFIKLEHTLFSLPFVFIGALLAGDPSITQLLWIFVAAIGARGLAMTLNRIIDKDVDAANPRTAQRHLPSGRMSMRSAWSLSFIFLSMLLLGAWRLNMIALQLAWIPVLAFVIYPFLKRRTWLCHLWLGICLGLAPAGAWLGVYGVDAGWDAVSGMHWWPQLFLVCFAVMLWISAFDLGYSQMDIDSDLANGIYSFPARFGPQTAIKAAVILTLLWGTSLAIAVQELWWQAATALMVVANIIVLTSSRNDMVAFQNRLFRTSVSTGWVLLAGLSIGLFI